MTVDSPTHDPQAVGRLAALATQRIRGLSDDLPAHLQQFADTLCATLRAQLVYVRVATEEGGTQQAAATAALEGVPLDPRQLGAGLERQLDLANTNGPVTILGPEGRPLRGIAVQVAIGERFRGTVLACSPEDDFPDDRERLLLTTGAAQVAILAQRQNREARRRAHEASLHATQARAEQLMQLMPVAVCVCDREGNVHFYNQRARELLGEQPRPDETWGGFAAKFKLFTMDGARVPPDATPMMQAARDGRSFRNLELRVVRPDGSRFFASANIEPLRDSRGEAIGVIGVIQDITEHKLAAAQQQALYELASHVNRAAALSDIYDAALTAICACQQADRAAILLRDPDGAMRFKAWRGLSDGYRAAVEGHSPWRHDDPNPQPVWIDDIATAELDETLRAVVQREGIRALAFIPLSYERRLLGKFMIYYDGARSFTASELRPVTAIASQVAFAIERQKSAEALDSLVNERTASLREAIAQMEEFSYSVSHDLRAPVRAMRGYAESLLQDFSGQLESDGLEMLRRIRANSIRMDRLIVDLLTYSRISRRELSLERVSLGNLLREIVVQHPEMQRPRATIELADALPDVLAHEPSLLQAATNLLSNAVKFVPPGTHPHVRVQWERRDGRVRVWFADNGIGIKPEHQTRLFGLFERVHAQPQYDGTGIGLAIVRKALERMNGRVGVESDGVSGSRFWIELALATA